MAHKTNPPPSITTALPPQSQQLQSKKRKASSPGDPGDIGSIILSAQLASGVRKQNEVDADASPVLSASAGKEGTSVLSDEPKPLEFSPAKKQKGHERRNSEALMKTAGTLKGLFNIAWHETFDPLVISAGKDFLPNAGLLFSTTGFLWSTAKGAVQITSKQLFGEKLAKDLKAANDKVIKMGKNRTEETKINHSFTALDTEESRERAQGVGEAMSGQVPRDSGHSL